MKIGLLTYHHSGSYGATLQTYATCKVLQKLGHDVTIINLSLAEYGYSLKGLVVLPKDIATHCLWKRIYPKLTREYKTSEALRNAKFDFDVLMVGSDQVWNPEISKDLCLSFFLDFGDPNIKRLSYASSFGISVWPEKYEKYKDAISRALSRFNAVSVREATGRKLLKEYFGFESTLVIDPTLLITDYSEITGELKDNNRLICFTMNHTLKQLTVVKEFAEFMGEKPYQMASIRPFKGFKYIYPPTLPSWLRYIAGAKFVVTDSFHGLVFCLQYHKQFVVITPDNGRNSRMKDLLILLGLENRFYRENDQISFSKILNESIDYESVDRLLAAERSKSLNFLNNNLNC